MIRTIPTQMLKVTIFLYLAGNTTTALGFSPSCTYSKLISNYKPLQCSHFITTEKQRDINVLSSSNITAPVMRIEASERIQKLRDLCLQKDILRDLTASEFAIRLEFKKNSSNINYDKLISNLNHDINILNLRKYRSNSSELIDRVISTKDDLVRIKNGDKSQYLVQRTAEMDVSDDSSQSSSITMSKSDAKSVRELRESLKLVVREDGTVDWDGALASSKEVARFGSELWERINGKDEGLPTISELFGQMQSKLIETEEISRLREIATITQEELNEIKFECYQLKVKLRELRKNGEPIDSSDIQRLQKLEFQYKEIEKRVRLVTLNLDIERICVYLEQEIDSSSNTYDLRSLIAEVALIDKQLTNILAGLRLNIASSSAEVAQSVAATAIFSDAPELISLIDDDELNLICIEVNVLKGQLGLGPQPGRVMDWGSLGVLVSENIAKIKQGFEFYGEGTKILLNDLQYAWILLIKAAQGNTLKPREVNSMRRTGKDILTLIPFTIILLIPLSPIGHVLVFSFIQRFYPDFFPSCYTEKRLNLRKLLTEIEKKDLDDLLGGIDDDDMMEQQQTGLFSFSKPSFNFSVDPIVSKLFQSRVNKSVSEQNSLKY